MEKRDHVIAEIRHTETSYVTGLVHIHELYYTPLAQSRIVDPQGSL